MDSNIKSELLYKLQDKVDNEVWCLLSAGCKIMPPTVRDFVAKNTKILADAYEAEGIESRNIINLETYNGILNVESLIYNISNRMIEITSNWDTYFYHEPLGCGVQPLNARTKKWLAVVIPKSRSEADDLRTLVDVLVDYVDRATVVVAHG